MSVKKIYWRNREGKLPPKHARFFWQSFEGKLVELDAKICATLPSPTVSIPSALKTFFPDREAWGKGVERVVDAIRNNELEKAVLARRCELELLYTPSPFAVAAALEKKALGACLFCVETEEFSFLGASPERLFLRKGRNIITEAIAGTRKRGVKEKQDLLRSAKDFREIAPVQRFLKEALAPLIQEGITVSPISVHQTAHVQHLYSSIKAALREKVSDFDLLQALHPTPALAGMPQQQAKKLIGEIEKKPRGLYGGVLGWRTEEASEWIVLIRCCLLEKNKASLFSGTGIVEGSESDSEWEELDQKLKLFEGIFL